MTPEEFAEIRAHIEKHGPPLSPMLIFTLMDALEAAWAELEHVEATNCAVTSQALEAFERAERAEDNVRMARQESDRQNARAVRAEAEGLRDLNATLVGDTGRAEHILDRVRELLLPFADGCEGTGEYARCHYMSEAVEAALDALDGGDQ